MSAGASVSFGVVSPGRGGVAICDTLREVGGSRAVCASTMFGSNGGRRRELRSNVIGVAHFSLGGEVVDKAFRKKEIARKHFSLAFWRVPISGLDSTYRQMGWSLFLFCPVVLVIHAGLHMFEHVGRFRRDAWREPFARQVVFLDKAVVVGCNKERGAYASAGDHRVAVL